MEEQKTTNGKTHTIFENLASSSYFVGGYYEQNNETHTENLLEYVRGITRPAQTLTANSLADLLKEWNLFHELYEILKSKGITVNGLKYMKTRHLDDILGGVNMSTKIIFEHKLGNWQNENGIYNLKPKSNLESHKDLTAPINSHWLANVGETASSSSTYTSESEALTVLSILKKREHGKLLLKKYERTKKLTAGDRSWIAHYIIRHEVETEGKLSIQQCKDLAEQIIAIFPTENISAYFIYDKKKKQAKGKLWHHYQNRLSFSKKITVIPERQQKFAGDLENINFPDTVTFEEYPGNFGRTGIRWQANETKHSCTEKKVERR